LGKWISRDPIYELGGKNLSSFCKNNPINSYDIWGLVDPINGQRAHKAFFKWLREKRPGEFVLDAQINITFKDLTSGLKPDVLHLKKRWVWDLKPFHPLGATKEEIKQIDEYIEALKARCFKKGPPRFVVPHEHTFVGEIDDAVYPGKKLNVYVSPGYEDGLLTYILESEDFDDDFWDDMKEVKPEDIPWYLLLPIMIILIPVGA
jgi:hypothetical protein